MKGYYKIPAEVWDAEKCAKIANRIATDGMGTPYPFKGACPEVKGKGAYENGQLIDTGTIRFNGGTTRYGDKWYQGVVHQLPKLAKGYKWVYVTTWCWRIIKEVKKSK